MMPGCVTAKTKNAYQFFPKKKKIPYYRMLRFDSAFFLTSKQNVENNDDNNNTADNNNRQKRLKKGATEQKWPASGNNSGAKESFFFAEIKSNQTLYCKVADKDEHNTRRLLLDLRCLIETETGGREKIGRDSSLACSEELNYYRSSENLLKYKCFLKPYEIKTVTFSL